MSMRAKKKAETSKYLLKMKYSVFIPMKTIANSGNCEDKARMRRIWFNFTA